MQNLRIYGRAPYAIAVIHGGPGTSGEMAPVARELSHACGVLEPIQTSTTLDGQVQELEWILEKHSAPPVVLIGFSWGAWLSFIVAARYPELVKKLVLVGCGPFEEKFVSTLHETRLSRLNNDEKAEFDFLLQDLSSQSTNEKDCKLKRLGSLASKTDTYDALPDQGNGTDRIETNGGNIYQKVWGAASNMRKSGELLRLAENIKCPVIAIHGDYDPHPVEGVKEPLSVVLKDFRLVVIEMCGHKPWVERQAQEQFYSVLHAELL
jgi:pimeloyl-ACP methyl ester carboxylesterase